MSELLDRVRVEARLRYYSRRTEKTYDWISNFIRFHDLRHPESLGSREIRDFLSHLALERNVAISTQKVALNALVFLYRRVLERPEVDFSGFRLATKREEAARCPHSRGALTDLRQVCPTRWRASIATRCANGAGSTFSGKAHERRFALWRGPPPSSR